MPGMPRDDEGVPARIMAFLTPRSRSMPAQTVRHAGTGTGMQSVPDCAACRYRLCGMPVQTACRYRLCGSIGRCVRLRASLSHEPARMFCGHGDAGGPWQGTRFVVEGAEGARNVTLTGDVSDKDAEEQETAEAARILRQILPGCPRAAAGPVRT